MKTIEEFIHFSQVIIYSRIIHYLSLFVENGLYAELEACGGHLKYAADADEKIVGSEIRELKMALDLLI
jgi:hypothetical protein